MRFCDLRQGMSWLIIVIISGLSARAQDLTPWTSNPYGNQWIDYSKKYVRVGVQTNGIYKVSYSSLATALQMDGVTITPEKIQLWHRGQQVAILSANSTEVVFYGEKNDGASDGLMFRPGPEARLNTYSSFFSEEGSYFFTVADSPLRSVETNSAPVSSVTPEAYHFETFLKKFDDYDGNGVRLNTQKFSFATFQVDATLNQSYFTDANSWTGPTLYGPSVLTNGNPRSPQSYSNTIALKNFVSSAGVNPVFVGGVHGHDTGQHIIKTYLSNSAGDIDSKEVGSATFSGYGGAKINADLILNTNVASDGTVNLKVKSVSTSVRDYYGISFFTITYPQAINVTGLTSTFLNFKSSGNSKSIIPIIGTSASTKVYDVSDPNNPITLTNGAFNSATSTLSIEVNRPSGKGLKLLVINSGYVVTDLTNFKAVDFTPVYEQAKTGVNPRTSSGALNPAAFDYLIITNNDEDPVRAGERDLRDGAKAYARDFRGQAIGGGYSTLVMDIRSIYNQFNYGEPSAVAIKRFVDYMLQAGIRVKHNLLLIGYNISYPPFITKEMPGEVPTFGDPGSDILLVTGLVNSPNPDVPAIPVGRINAFTKTELAIYRSKVVEYLTQTIEGPTEALEYRKNIIHLVGAKRYSELAEFKDIFSGVSTYVHALDPSRIITTISNDTQAASDVTDAPTTPAPMAPKVNPGVGMIAYYGHGSQTATIYNIGKVSDPSYQYMDNNKYTFIYFNGCGIGNVFTSRSTQLISTDWLVTPNRGAIAMFSNSYKSYVSPTKIYIDQLYQQLFLKNDSNRKTVGQILVDLGKITVNGSADARMMADQFQITNIHQTNLYGDPALYILNTTPSPTLPVDLVKFKAKAEKNGDVSLTWTTTSETNNSHFDIERSYNARDFEMIGRVDGKGTINQLSNYEFIDKEPFSGVSYYRLKQVDIAGVSNNGKGEVYSQTVSVDIDQDKTVFIFPNPAVSKVTMRMDIPTSVKSWKIYNQKGQVVKTGVDFEANVEALNSGIYVLEVLSAFNDVFRRSFIKK